MGTDKLITTGLYLFSGLMTFSIVVASPVAQTAQPELKLVHVVFRHGDRAPDSGELYPNDPHRNNPYYPMGLGGLTNAGKMREYRLGQLLRSRYDNLLGPIYEPRSVEARSTDYDRTKMSLQLVLSSLFAPSSVQLWNENLMWQPIPTTYKSPNEDILLIPEDCPKYQAELRRVRNSSEVREKESKFRSLMEYVQRWSGKSTNTTTDLYYFYHMLTTQAFMNLTLPEWTNDIYPDGELLRGAALEYQIISYNEKLKRLNGGMLLRKITEDAVALRRETLPAGRKIYLYSGHETNIGALLSTLGLYEPHVPAYGSALIVEHWKQARNHFIKVIYYTGVPDKLVTKRITGCGDLCPLDRFLELTKPVIPSDDEVFCVKESTCSVSRKLQSSSPVTNSEISR
ncbi:venom acid phosphatase Acph-1-like [Athalia rosae]|uniref:venom acid phosphatase Acph-1-like n=1 Tax=Athalia rosae TaxID=37344 RepID=UPI0020338CC1|nr:venom acid phosphatase Acph-1-like [Athalia rosae]XP_025602646.2 venom acid phosphatase Acph-1-like [Athalia rosae]XP_025602647.2 venom acid phosphatase Acph-1-like [Athalia rosae]XP_048513016.1 venom acid phosphatase Acph-1-like [Athalia rosae]